MLRYLLPLGTGVLLMAGFVLCQDLTTGAGVVPLPEGTTDIEDWCGDVRGRFEVTYPAPASVTPSGSDGIRAVYGGECSNFGGYGVIEGFGATLTSEQAEIAIASTAAYNMAGKQAFFEFIPWGTPVEYQVIELFRTTSGGASWGVVIDLWEGDTPYRIQPFITHGATFDIVNVDYDPATMRWFRFWHDAATNDMGIDTAGFCGEWVNRLTVAGAGVPSSVKIGWTSEGYPEGSALIQTYQTRWGTIYVDDYPGGGS